MAAPHTLAAAARVAGVAVRAPRSHLPGPTIHVAFKTASFESPGRYFLTLTAPDGTEHRTEVSSEESRHPKFQAKIYSLGISRSDAEAPLAPLKVGATRLAFSRGATEVGSASVACAALLAARTGVQQHTLELTAQKGSSSTHIGTVVLEYTYEDAAEEARKLAERREAEAAERAAFEQAEAERRAIAAEEAARAAREQAEEEAVLAAQLAAESARLEAEDRKAQEADQLRLTAMAKAAMAAAATQQAAVEELLRAEAERARTLRRWRRILASPVHLLRDDGLIIELTGRQVVGLEGKSSQSPSGLVAFEQGTRRITLSGAVLAKMRQRVEARMQEEDDDEAEEEEAAEEAIEEAAMEEEEDVEEIQLSDDGAGVFNGARAHHAPLERRSLRPKAALIIQLSSYVSRTPSALGSRRAATTAGALRRPLDEAAEPLPTGSVSSAAALAPPRTPEVSRPQHASAPAGGRVAGVPVRALAWLGQAAMAPSPSRAKLPTRAKVGPHGGARQAELMAPELS